MNELALFAGAGGGILGGKLLGWRTVCAVERDAYAAAILAQRQNDGCLEPFPIWSDVETFDGTPWRGIVDVISGGFPCQDISAAGRGAGLTGARSGLWKQMARIVGEIRPRYVFIENSPMLRTRGLSTVLKDLAEMGYNAEWGVLGAHNVGAPHKRDRMWILATHSRLIPEGAIQNIRPESQESERQDAAIFCGDVADARYVPRGHGAEPVEAKSAAIARCSEVDNSLLSGLEGAHDNRQTPQRLQSQSLQRCDETNPERRRRVTGGRHTGASQIAQSINSGENMADSIGQRQPGPGQSWYACDPAESGEGETDNAFHERVGNIWGIESSVGRVAHGVAHRVDRLKAIGNGQVPAVAALAWRTLMGEQV